MAAKKFIPKNRYKRFTVKNSLSFFFQQIIQFFLNYTWAPVALIIIPVFPSGLNLNLRNKSKPARFFPAHAQSSTTGTLYTLLNKNIAYHEKQPDLKFYINLNN